MIYNLQEFEAEVQAKNLRKSETNDLVLYNYTDACTYARHWAAVTKKARGIIFEKSTGLLIAKPFDKFFNLGETEECFLKNLPDEPYTVHEKMDGSLGIIYHYKDQWHVATRGSFNSDQAIVGAELLKKYDMSLVHEDCTLLVEIIYPSNKIIVNYGKEEALVVIGASDRTTGKDLDPDHVNRIVSFTGMPKADVYNYTIEQMLELQKTLPKDQEGFVVRYASGLRVKIKGVEYMRISKLMAHMGPLALWECMKDGVVDTQYLTQLPEEMRPEYEETVELLEHQYRIIGYEIEETVKNHKLQNTSPDWKRTVGMYIHSHSVKHQVAVFPYLLNNKEALNNYIMKTIRPSGNEMINL